MVRDPAPAGDLRPDADFESGLKDASLPRSQDTDAVRAALMTALAAVLIGCGAERRTSARFETPPANTANAVIAPAPHTVIAPPVAPAPASTSASAEVPAPDEPIPRGPVALSGRLADVSAALRGELRRWRSSRPARRALPPHPIGALVLYEQRAYRLLAREPRLADATLRRLPSRTRAEARDSVAALRGLFSLSSPTDEKRFRVAPAKPPGVLYGYYRAAERRFGVRWTMLAAVNMVETNFGRLRNVSSAGAIGPMQFIPATWRAYGLGGDIRDPRDAILGAANYLHASGAPARPAQALYSYNPSRLYVAAVQRWARRMALRPATYYAYWSQTTFVRTTRGDVQLVDERG